MHGGGWRQRSVLVMVADVHTLYKIVDARGTCLGHSMLALAVTEGTCRGVAYIPNYDGL